MGKEVLEIIVMDDRIKKASPAADKSRDAETTPEESSESFVAYMNDPAEPLESGDTGPQEQRPTSEKALDRWFKERQKNKGAPRLLDIPNEALISRGGPMQITGNIMLINEDRSVEYANHLNLCRCGGSRSKPTCDGQHLEREFLNTGKITQISEFPASQRATRITISCIKDGPITFRGNLRLHNQFGQECVKIRGSLCRCGQSANKPFCDGSHVRTGFRTKSG
jgi:CDGSH-type Zn-finger protein